MDIYSDLNCLDLGSGVGNYFHMDTAGATSWDERYPFVSFIEDA
jgi:hypothetical protein